jgi:hypothetical protein
MIKAFGALPNGRPLALFGLSGENMTRLMAGEPIKIDLPEAALGYPMPPLTVVICGGRTEEAIVEEVAGSPLAQYLKQ